MPAKKRKVMNPRINWTRTEKEEFLQTVVNLKDKFEMDQHQDGFGSVGDSDTLEIERSDADIVDGCTEQRYIPLMEIQPSPPNHVTKVSIGPRETILSVADIMVFSNDSAPEAVNSSGSSHHNVSSPFGPPEDHGVSSHTQEKPHNELAEALSHLNMGGQGMGATSQSSVPVSPTLSREFQISNPSEIGPQSKKPFLEDAHASNTNAGVFPSGSSPEKFSESFNPAAISTGIIPPAINQQAESTPVPQSMGSGNILDPPGALQSPDSLGNVAKSATRPIESSQALQPVGTTRPEDSLIPSLNSDNVSTSPTNVIQTTLPDVTIQSQNSNTLSSKYAEPLVPNTIQPTPNHPDDSEPARIQILNTACSQEMPPIQESINTPDHSASSFHFPEPTRPAPQVCVPAKEVKFEEPPKHQSFSALETLVEKLGEIVPITVQPGHTTQNVAKARYAPNVIVLPTYSASQCQSKAKDESSAPQTASDQASNSQTESKTNNFEILEAEVLSHHQAGHEEHEQSYGIIGNEDNLSEIPLPPLAEGGANHRDNDEGPSNNGHPCHRIRISTDQQSATPSRKEMAITGLLVVMLISTLIVLGVYEFVHIKSSPD